MRILFCNKYNYPFSGTEAYLFEAMELLRSKGHEAALFSMADPLGPATPYDHHFVRHTNFKTQSSWLERLALAAHAIYSTEARRKLRAMITEFRPDVAHVRNIYHHLSPSILWELKARRVPVLYHLNDFKLLCPSYNLVARGNACEACKGGQFWQMLKTNCYPGLAERATLVTEAYFHKLIGTYRKCVNCFLAPSEFVRDKFVEHGWDARKFEVLPHFQRTTPDIAETGERRYLLYFGRLSAEKGVDDLVHAMEHLPHLQLVIAGDGPERAPLEGLSAALGLLNVQFVGHLRGDDLNRTIASSLFTVLPSHAYETLGKTILESYAHGRAVIATDFGSRRELVSNGKTGVLYRMGDVPELTAAIALLGSRPLLADQMGLAGQNQVLRRYTPDAHYEKLLELYEQLVAGTKRSPQPRQSNSVAAPQFSALSGIVTDQLEQNSFFPIQALTLAPAALRESGNVRSRVSPKPALRIAFIGGRGLVSKYSGIETYYEEVGARMVGMGHQVTAYCRSYFTPAVAEHIGMRVVRLPAFRTKHLETLLHTLFSTIHVLTQPCDVVHYHALGPALFSFIPRLVGKKTVVTVQGLDWQRKKWGEIASAVLRVGERAAITLPDSTMVVSQTLRQHYWEKHGVETSYVPNGGLLRDREGADKLYDWGLEPGNYILFLGRLSPEKGCHLLVEAYERLHSSTKLVLAGAASYCDEYARELRGHATDNLKILDWISGAALDRLLTNAMLFVLPSDIEGLSLALLDAMGAGLCVLTSDIPENREAVDEAGFTFRRGDAGDLADRLRFLIANPAVRKASGEAARRRVQERYQWNEISARVEEEYFKIMGWRLEKATARKPSTRVDAASGDAQRKTG